MAINAANREHIINDVERRGDPKLAAILRTGQNAEFDEWYKNEWTPNNPDAPSDQDYNYRLMYEQGKMPTKSGDGALQFLPEEYWINRRGKAHTPPFGGFMPLPDADVNYDVNSGSWQFENGMMRMVRKGAAKAYQTGLDMFAGGFTDYAADLGAYGGDREKARQDMEQALTPDVLEQAQINESETWGGAGEMIGSTLVEFGLYFATGGAGLKTKAEATVAKNGFNMGKLKGFLQGLGHRIEMASSPDAIGAEILYANNPENTESLASNLGNLLKENGVEGPVVDYLASAKDDPYARVVSNIIEGMLFFEAARTVGHIGFKGGKAAWNKASEVVMSKYDEAVRELDVLGTALNTSMVAYHGSPHKFDRFSADKIGGGEGNQSFGHGLYFAEDPKISGWYAKKLSRRATSLTEKVDMLTVGDQKLRDVHKIESDREFANLVENGDMEAARKYAVERRDRWAELIHDRNYPYQDYAKERATAWNGVALDVADGKVGTTAKGFSYEVDIPDEVVNKMLDWDAPIEKQPENVRKALLKWRKDNGSAFFDGQGAYREMVFQQRMNGAEDPERAASKELERLGVPGIRYLDGMSRSKGKGTRNLVVFNDNNVKTVKRNGEKVN